MIRVLLVLLLAAGAAQAQPAAFSRIGFGARGIALGSAGVADASGLGMPHYNPALTPAVGRQHVEGSVGLLTHDREVQYLQVGASLPPRAGVAAGLTRAAVTDIDGRDASGLPTQTLQSEEFLYFLAFGLRPTSRLSAGLSMQIVRSELASDAEPGLSIGIDLGLLYAPSERLTLGLVVDDLLARYTFEGEAQTGFGAISTTDRLPTRLRAGAGYTLGDSLGGLTRVLVEAEARFSAREVVRYRTVVVGGAPQRQTLSDERTTAEAFVRAGVEHTFAHLPFSVQAGVDGIGGRGWEAAALRPSAGFSVERPAGTIRLRLQYAARLEPYGQGVMQLLTVRALL
jgi:hypothetical protein